MKFHVYFIGGKLVVEGTYENRGNWRLANLLLKKAVGNRVILQRNKIFLIHFCMIDN